MIVSASCRTDIPAFYTPWLLNRLEEGFVDVRNPFYPKRVSRIYFEDADAWMFCTKNPLPLIPYLDRFKQPILMDVTITPYKKDLEPAVSDKTKIIEAVRFMGEKLGKDHVSVRYDPILLNPTYTVDYHIRAFERLCSLLEGAVETISISFLDDYKNVRRHAGELNAHEPSEAELKAIGEAFAKCAADHGIPVFTCNEKQILAPFGVPSGACFPMELALAWTGRKFRKWKARDCGCVEMADLGVYNTCAHLCRYCYANFDEKQIAQNRRLHDPSSTMLVGHLEADDEIIRRKR